MIFRIMTTETTDRVITLLTHYPEAPDVSLDLTNLIIERMNHEEYSTRVRQIAINILNANHREITDPVVNHVIMLLSDILQVMSVEIARTVPVIRMYKGRILHASYREIVIEYPGLRDIDF